MAAHRVQTVDKTPSAQEYAADIQAPCDLATTNAAIPRVAPPTIVQNKAVASDQPTPGELAQDGQRTCAWVVLLVDSQMKSLLQHILTRHDRMRSLIRKADPDRTGSKRHGDLLSTFLISHIPLHAIMQLQHQMIVFATI